MKKEYRYILPGLLLLLFLSYSPQSAYAFSDTTRHWASPAIDHLTSRGLLSGYPDGSFRPEASVNRAELITILVKGLNKDREAQELQKGTSSFYDAGNSWAKGYIELARELHIASGDGRGYFRPGIAVSREEAITMLVKSMGPVTGDLPDLSFTDEEQISPWARSSIQYAVNAGLLQGFPDGTFKPGQSLSRAEAAILMEEYLTLQGQKFHFYGTLKNINLPLKRATVYVNGREETFELAPNLTVYEENGRQRISELNLPAPAYFDLTPNGKLGFLYISKNPPSGRLQIKSFSLPDYEKNQPVSEGMIKLTADTITDETLKASTSTAIRNPARSLNTTRQAMKANDMEVSTGATGRGQLVAVIDSGVDTGHPDLHSTEEGYRKILDFVDLTDEGKVLLTDIKAENGFLEIGDKKINVRGIENQAESFKYAYLKLDFLPPEFRASHDQMLVLVTASRWWNYYDTIYLDTDFNGELSGQNPIQEYKVRGQSTFIAGEGEKKFTLVASEIPSSGDYVKLGFDCLGHGTEVAGIIAANGKIKGIAPDAQILPIKVLDRTGTASMKKLESAISLAAERGVKVAAISMGQYQINQEERQSLTNLAANVWKAHGMILCMAAGNNGPGLGTVADSAGIENIISVGAYATPEMWEVDYGWKVEKPTIWYFSSTGPAAGGQTAPLVLAPGSAISTYPLWGSSIYQLDEGTSIATPHVAGAAALMLDASAHLLYDQDSRSVYQALIAGAEPLPDYQAVEQGRGAVNLMQAWKEMQMAKAGTDSYSARQLNPGYGLGSGYYSRATSPGEVSLRIKNNGEETQELSVGGLASWIKPQQYTVQVPVGSERRVDIKYDIPEDPGLYSSFLAIDNYKTLGWDTGLLQTVIVPYKLEDYRTGFTESGTLGAGQYKRYFFLLPEGLDGIDFKLVVKDMGRASMHVISPSGRQESSQYAGRGESNITSSVNMHYNRPAAGCWEVVVYSSVALESYNMKESQYTLKIDTSGNADKPEPASREYLLTTVAPSFEPGKETALSLFFWNANSKLPAEGMVCINDRWYEINNGLVKLDILPEEDVLNISVGW
jgi:tripeptidyl-peptidase-2